MKILLITPPMTQINTPYPATTYLTGFLKQEGYDVAQADFSIELFTRLFSRSGINDCVAASKRVRRPNRIVGSFIRNGPLYAKRIDGVIRFLQGAEPTLSKRLVQSGYLPRSIRFQILKEIDPPQEIEMRAKFLASLFIDDIADAIREGVDSRFELSRYGEKLAASAPSLDPLLDAINGPASVVDQYVDSIARHSLTEHRPDVVGLSIPFPGNVYGGLRIARMVREVLPRAKVVMGGGYVNTELRELSESRLFDWVDFVTLDDGAAPIRAIIDSLQNGSQKYLRTFVRKGAAVELVSNSALHDVPLRLSGTPTYAGLSLSQYVSLTETLNPMHSLWSEGRWNKLTLAHGCYWKKCTFCDTSLDYISRYEPQSASLVVDRMEALIGETGDSGFHFVDEAAPPALLGALSREILRRGLKVTWWTNIRFEKSFNVELAQVMLSSGCVAISAGLEVASNRLLALMEKGITVEQVARVTRAFSVNGIMVHAYLMYGFPSQTIQETVDALERVRQLFQAGLIQSAFWHRFSTTAHSPIGRNPDRYGIVLRNSETRFAKNDLEFVEPDGEDPEPLAFGLKKALYNFMHGGGLENDVRFWFESRVPRPTVSKRWLTDTLLEDTKRLKEGHCSGVIT